MSTNTSGDGELPLLNGDTIATLASHHGIIKCWNDGCDEGKRAKRFTDDLMQLIQAHTRQQVQKAQLEVVKEISEDSKYAEDRHAREVQQRLDDKAYFLMSDLKQEYKEES